MIEETLLAKLIIQPDSYIQASDLIKEEYFIKPENKAVYATIKNLWGQGIKIDLLSVKTALNSLESNYLVNITSQYVDYDTKNLCTQLRNNYAKNIVNLLVTYGATTKDTPDQVSKKILSYANDIAEIINFDLQKTRSILDIGKEVIKSIEKASNMDIVGIPTNIKEVDNKLGGYQNGNLFIVAGRPGMGKTAYAMCNTLEIAKKGFGAAFFSLEMSDTELLKRLISIDTQINSHYLKVGRVDNKDYSDIQESVSKMHNQNLFIYDKCFTLDQILSSCRRLKKENKLDIVFIDYLQLIEHKGESRQNAVSDISRKLKLLAKDLNIPVVALSQLSRAVENRPDKMPQLSDLRESGAIEQDADIVTFLFRPEYYEFSEWSNGDSCIGQGALIVSKNRNGSTGLVKMKWIGETTTYTNLNNEVEEIKPNYDF